MTEGWLRRQAMRPVVWLLVAFVLFVRWREGRWSLRGRIAHWIEPDYTARAATHDEYITGGRRR